MSQARLQYIADERGEIKGVIVPIELWRQIESDLETSYLLKSQAMRKRLLEAKKRREGIPLGEALAKLGI